MLFVALSCLQGRPQAEAFAELTALSVDGIQLTPGNLPSPGFQQVVERYPGRLRFHHAFSFQHYRAEVYDPAGRTPRLPRSWSLHPPPVKHAVTFRAWLRGALEVDALCEVMYPGFRLGCDGEVREAMAAGLRLAVDISHLHIQRCRGDLSCTTLRDLFDYPGIEEVHVSHNEGRADSHRLVCADTPWLAWARERERAGAALIFESRMHAHDARWREQLEFLK